MKAGPKRCQQHLNPTPERSDLDLLSINLEERDANREFLSSLCLLNVREDVAHRAGDDALHVGVSNIGPKHCMRLAGARLPVCKESLGGSFVSSPYEVKESGKALRAIVAVEHVLCRDPESAVETAWTHPLTDGIACAFVVDTTLPPSYQ